MRTEIDSLDKRIEGIENDAEFKIYTGENNSAFLKNSGKFLGGAALSVLLFSLIPSAYERRFRKERK